MNPISDAQIEKFVADLSSQDIYERKHAAWMLARLAQRGMADAAVRAGAIPVLIRCLGDEMIVRYRAVWALGELAKNGQCQAVRESGAKDMLERMVEDTAGVEICSLSGELVPTTLGALAGAALQCIGD